MPVPDYLIFRVTGLTFMTDSQQSLDLLPMVSAARPILYSLFNQSNLHRAAF